METKTCLNCNYASHKRFYTKDEKECYFYCSYFEMMLYEDIEKPSICEFYQKESN